MPLLSSHSAGEVATDLTRSNATTAVDNVTTLPGRLHGGLEEVRLRLPAKDMAGVLPQFAHPENHIRGTGGYRDLQNHGPYTIPIMLSSMALQDPIVGSFGSPNPPQRKLPPLLAKNVSGGVQMSAQVYVRVDEFRWTWGIVRVA